MFGAWIAALTADLAAWSLISWAAWTRRAASSVPLHYNIYFGVDWIGPWYALASPAFFGFLVLAVNLVLILMIYEEERFLSYALAGGTVFLELIILAASFFVFLLNQG